MPRPARGALAPAAALGVSGAGYTTVNTAVDGTGHCKNGNPAVNCNIYDGKQFVWLNGGPAAGGLGPDGQYFFAVLAPGGQPNPNDGGAKNLSDDFDTYQNRTFTVTNGEVSAYGGTHDKQIPLIRLAPTPTPPNPGGVYIMAICSLGAGYPVAPRSCKYDAFKVKAGAGKVQAVLSGKKYFDANQNGQFDAGEDGLANWSITLTGTDGTNTTLTTDNQGDWSYTVPAHSPAAGYDDLHRQGGPAGRLDADRQHGRPVHRGGRRERGTGGVHLHGDRPQRRGGGSRGLELRQLQGHAAGVPARGHRHERGRLRHR